ncbi:MAG: hypothetical protein MUC87_03265 [Bacteroidia bacterium]|jgi:hypothetical protein|nr:hypothetical protein [Bacteroidia bacterium]
MNQYTPPPPGYNQPYGNQPGFPPMQQDLPDASTIQILGILSLVLTGLIGLILAIIALSKSKQAMSTYQQNPGVYSEASFSKVKIGRTCAIIELCLFGLLLLILFIVLGFVSFAG